MRIWVLVRFLRRPRASVRRGNDAISDVRTKSAIPVPFVGKLLGRKDEQQNAADRRLLNETVDEVIAARQTSGERRSDLLDRMLHPEAGEGLDAENIRNQVLTFLVAGHETSVNALSFALHFIGQNPDIAARMRAEAEDIIGTGPVRYEDVPRLRYTRQVINEALRLWPTAPGFFRAAKQDTEVGGHAFAAGEWVFVLLLAVQRDPAWGLTRIVQPGSVLAREHPWSPGRTLQSHSARV
ncbi:cytochrome P450, partial [Rhodococcus hoagii]|nr:cytochrome P450 [Prescottella equi]